MNANATATAPMVSRAKSAPRADWGHRLRLRALYVLAFATNLAIFFYGFDYYKLSAIDRPFSPKHHLLRPSGPLGLYLGFMGVALFVGIFMYPIRKHWTWLGQIGRTRHWLDFHVLMGLTAPFIIAFHSTLKFRGIAGMAFWIMFAVSVSGVVGRYLYAQIPRKVSTAELSLKELQELQQNLAQQLAAQHLLLEADLRALLRLPDAEFVKPLPTVIALVFAGESWHVTGDSLIAFLSAGMAFVAVAAIFGPMWRRHRLDARSLLVGGVLYLAYLGIVVLAVTGILPIG